MKHNNSLDGLRGVAILLVVAGHSWMAYGNKNTSIGWLAPCLFNSTFGVRLFFVLSGYLITCLLLEERETTGSISLRKFYARRALRIFPAFYVFLGCILLMRAAGIIEVQYPASMVSEQRNDIPRIAFHIFLSLPGAKQLTDTVVCDIGGGIGLFSVGCAALGFGKVILVDDFGDGINRKEGGSVLEVHRRYGVEVVSRDVVREGISGLFCNLDVVTSFDSMEHWHGSPKSAFHELISSLNLHGRFVLGVPNCVNLRKRLTVPFGFGQWSSMEDWYEAPLFRGYVREPDARDLYYLAKDLKLEHARVLGRNWLGSQSSSLLLRVLTRLGDPLIRWRPSLCSNLYLVGQKSGRIME
jgi:SAM-dependent methyltransferase